MLPNPDPLKKQRKAYERSRSLQNTPRIWYPDWGLATFTRNRLFHFTESVTNKNKRRNPRERLRSQYHTEKLLRPIEDQLYYGRIGDWIRDYEKEVAYTDLHGKTAISFARRNADAHHCTMREVMCGNIVTHRPSAFDDRVKLIGMALDLHILQHLPHNSIVTLLSVNYSPIDQYGRFVLFYELSMPLIYYIRENAFYGRPNSVAVFENKEIAKYIVKCAANGLSHLQRYRIALGGNMIDAIYINYNGVPKLGSFLNAKFAEDDNDHRDDVIALGGVYVALLNQKILPTELQGIDAGFPHARSLFRMSYLQSVTMLKVSPVGGVFAPGTENYHYVRRFLAGLRSYNSMAHWLAIDDVTDLDGELRDLVRQDQSPFFSAPCLESESLEPVAQMDVIQKWLTLNLSLKVTTLRNINNVENSYGPELTVTLSGDTPPVKTFTDIVRKCILHRPDPDDYDANVLLPPYSFEPQDILVLYPNLVKIYHKMIPQLEGAAESDAAFSIGHYTQIDVDQYHVITFLIRGIDGVSGVKRRKNRKCSVQ